MLRKLTLTLTALCCCLGLLVLAAPADAAATYCDVECDFNSCATQGCTDPETEEPSTCQEWGIWDYNDEDCDGIDNGPDNCNSIWNQNQADCDGDGIGDACDSANHNYQATESLCNIATEGGNLLVGHWHFSVYTDTTYVDLSSCGAPSYVEKKLVDTKTCWGEFPFIKPDKYGCCVANYGSPPCDGYLDNNQCTGS